MVPLFRSPLYWVIFWHFLKLSFSPFGPQVSKDEILKLLRGMPLTEGVPEMLLSLKKIGSVFVIVSDANAIFIREPLDSRNLLDLFKKIVTNPAEFDQDGRLNMSPFTEQVQ